MNKQWEEDIRKRLANHEEPAPELSWTEIDAALASRRQASKPRIVPLWAVRTAAAAAILLIVGGVGVYRLNSFDKSNEEPTYSHLRDEDVPTSTMAEEQPPLPQTLPGKPSPTTKLTAEALMPTADTIIYNKVGSNQEEKRKVIANEEPRHKATPKKKSLDEGIEMPASTKKQPRHLMAQAWLGGGMNSNSGFGSGMVMVGADAPFGEYVGDNLQNNAVEDAPVVSRQLKSIDHHTPLRLGLGLRYRLNDRWSILAGLTYTRLSADMEYDDLSTATQRLHYIGIPLQASYSLWSTKHAHAYASAGATVEKMVYGRRTTTSQTYGEKPKEESEPLSIHPLQLSANVAIGLEYAFVKDLSLYAEPGLSYYFDNGSTVPTLYQDKPLNFNINVGLRINIK